MSAKGKTFRRHEFRNAIHSLLLMGTMIALGSVLGWLIWGLFGVFLTAITAVVMVLIGMRMSPRLVLRMYRARRLTEYEAPTLIGMVSQLSQHAGLSIMPDLYYIPSSIANAFTVGSGDEAAIAVTDGLLRSFNLRELKGVLAHEISHVAGNDGYVMGLADSVSQLVNIMSWIGQILLLINLPLFLMGPYQIPWLLIILLIFAPTISSLLQLALSRTREYEADLDAARLTGDPRGLASGLAKLERLSSNWFERIFLPGRRVPDPSLLRTHPPTEERIRRLLELEKDLAEQERDHDHGPLLPDLHRTPVGVIRKPRWHSSRFWY